MTAFRSVSCRHQELPMAKFANPTLDRRHGRPSYFDRPRSDERQGPPAASDEARSTEATAVPQSSVPHPLGGPARSSRKVFVLMFSAAVVVATLLGLFTFRPAMLFKKAGGEQMTAVVGLPRQPDAQTTSAPASQNAIPVDTSEASRSALQRTVAVARSRQETRARRGDQDVAAPADLATDERSSPAEAAARSILPDASVPATSAIEDAEGLLVETEETIVAAAQIDEPAAQEQLSETESPPRAVAELPTELAAPEAAGGKDIGAALPDDDETSTSAALSSQPQAPADDGVFEPARKLSAPAPEYPESARGSGIEGVVVAAADIDASGTVTDVRILRGLSPELDRAAASALSNWRFAPATRAGAPVPDVHRTALYLTPGPSPATASAPLSARSKGVTPPVKLVTPLPTYPASAWATGTRGDVKLKVVIDERGDVGEIEVVRGLPHGLTEAAIDAVKRWQFRPATRAGRPVAVSQNLTLRFVP